MGEVTNGIFHSLAPKVSNSYPAQMLADVLIVTAHKAEFDALMAVEEGALEAWVEQVWEGHRYALRRYAYVSGGSFRVAATWATHLGEEATKNIAQPLIQYLQPRCLAMCGTCTGRHGQVQLGDVILADRLYQYDTKMIKVGSGKNSKNKEIVKEPILTYTLPHAWLHSAQAFRPKIEWLQHNPRPLLLEEQGWWLLRNHTTPIATLYRHLQRPIQVPNWAETLSWLQKKGWLDDDFDTTYEGLEMVSRDCQLYPENHPPLDPWKFHLTPLATGKHVERIFEQFPNNMGNVGGVEQNASMLCMIGQEHGLPTLVCKGVADHAESIKDDRIFPWAARASAECLIAFLRQYLPMDTSTNISDSGETPLPNPFVVQRLHIQNFASIKELDINLSHTSSLDGQWTCLAGINGAGKTSVLQALCLVLLGPQLASQLGAARLSRLRHRNPEPQTAILEAWVEEEGTVHHLQLQIGPEGAFSDVPSAFWKGMSHRLLLSYGANRNLSSYIDRRNESWHPVSQRQATLFDPLSQIASAEVLLEQNPGARVTQAMAKLLGHILTDDIPLTVEATPQGLRWQMNGAPVTSTELPDGFRSTAAWVADLCVHWQKLYPLWDGDPRRIRALVLIDEVDLHLHSSLQRVLIQRLRKWLPQVQWVVTTHSPLILGSFDKQELILLDGQAEGGYRRPDRQVLGFTPNEIYIHLMGTSPNNPIVEEELRQIEKGNPAVSIDETAVLLMTDSSTNEAQAREVLLKHQRLVERLQKQKPV